MLHAGRDCRRRASVPRIPAPSGRDDLRDGWRALASPAPLEGSSNGPYGFDGSRATARLRTPRRSSRRSSPVQTPQGSEDGSPTRRLALGSRWPVPAATRSLGRHLSGRRSLALANRRISGRSRDAQQRVELNRVGPQPRELTEQVIVQSTIMAESNVRTHTGDRAAKPIRVPKVPRCRYRE